MTIAIAVIIHEIPRGFSTTVIMKNSKYGLNATLFALGLDSVLTPVGALLAGLLPTWLFGYMIAYSAGNFIYIGASDLFPEAHRRFNLKVVFSVLLGAVLTPALELSI